MTVDDGDAAALAGAEDVEVLPQRCEVRIAVDRFGLEAQHRGFALANGIGVGLDADTAGIDAAAGQQQHQRQPEVACTGHEAEKRHQAGFSGHHG